MLFIKDGFTKQQFQVRFTCIQIKVNDSMENSLAVLCTGKDHRSENKQTFYRLMLYSELLH